MSILIKSLDELKTLVAQLRERKQTIVFTNGCFDLLHEGHLYLLDKAKESGDILILGINSDISVKQLKGNTRPIQNLEKRIDNLFQLRQLDFIIVFDELTPVRLIEIVQPDVLVKGGDYIVENIAGHQIAKQTVIIPLLEGFSTTKQVNNPD